MKLILPILLLALVCGCRSYPNYAHANAYEREMGFFYVDKTMPDGYFVKTN
jgi:hypothetical protein